MTGTVGRIHSRLRGWAIGTLVLGTMLGGTAIAMSGSSARPGDDAGEMGPSPVPATAPVTGPTTFKVSSFNVLGYDHTAPGGSKRGFADGATRMKWASQLVKSRGVDVVGFQELQPPQYEKWVKKRSAQYDMFPGYIDTVGFLRNSIAWRKDKFQLVSTSWMRVPYFKGETLRMPIVLLQSIATGQQIYFMNFHNPANTRGNAEKWRLLGQRVQIALVNQLRASNGLPIVWTGDMNSRAQVFCRVTAQAAMISASGGSRTPTSCTPPGNMVVDWIFGSQVSFSNYVQDRSKKVARVSDHSMLLADVLVQPTTPLPLPTPTPTPTPTTTPTPTPTPTITVSPAPTPTP